MDLMGWLAVIIIFAVIEGFTMDLASIWFAFGALIAMIVALFTDSLLIQLVFFLLGTTIFMIYLRPIAKKSFGTKKVRTNIDKIIGEIGIVTGEVSLSDGEVKVSGKIWSARNFEDTKKIPLGAKVEILSIQGAKVIVKEIEETKEI